MASLSELHVRRCPECNQIHDCQFFVEMQVLCNRLDREINRLVEYVNKQEKNLVSEIPELEDK